MTSLRCWALCPGIPSVNYTIFLCTSPISKIQKMFVSNFHDFFFFFFFFFFFTRSSINCPHKLHTPACGRPSLVLLGQMSLRAPAANCSTVVKRLVEAPRPSLARGSTAGSASGGVEKNQEAACLCTRLATRKRNLFLLKTRELRPPAWPLAQRPAKQPARPLGKANEKSVLDFYLSNKVRRTGEPAGSPRARVQRKSSSESKCSSTTSCI